MIDISPDSIRVFLIIVLSVLWFYLFNQEIGSNDED